LREKSNIKARLLQRAVDDEWFPTRTSIIPNQNTLSRANPKPHPPPTTPNDIKKHPATTVPKSPQKPQKAPKHAKNPKNLKNICTKSV